MTQAISTALGGLQQSEDLLEQTASHMAQVPPFGPARDRVWLSDDAVALLQASNGFESNLDTIKVADEMQKSTLSLIG